MAAGSANVRRFLVNLDRVAYPCPQQVLAGINTIGVDPMSALHQFNLEYNSEQDRLLFRMSTRDGTEIRLWFTRRFVRRLWGLLIKLLERDPHVAAQTDPVAKKSVVAFQRDSAITQSDFSKNFEEKSAPALPLGEEPVLVTKCKATPTATGFYVGVFT